jgi:hypothetical protein
MSNNRRKEFATQAILCSNVLIANNLPRMDSNHDKVIQSLLWGFFAVLQRGAAWRFPSTETEFVVRSFSPFRIKNGWERSTPA